MSKKQKTTVFDQVNVAPAKTPTFVSSTTTLNMEIVVYPYDTNKAAAQTENLITDALGGKSLRRSKSTNDLAAKAAAFRGRKPASADAWASKLAGSLTSPND